MTKHLQLMRFVRDATSTACIEMQLVAELVAPYGMGVVAEPVSAPNPDRPTSTWYVDKLV